MDSKGPTDTPNGQEAPNPDGYDVVAKIVKGVSQFGEWTYAVWSCPFCRVRYEFHGAGPDDQRLVVATHVIATLAKGLQLRETCACGARQRIRRGLVCPATAGGGRVGS